MWKENKIEESSAPRLQEVKFEFAQEANCVDGPSDGEETITIRAVSDLGLDWSEGCFYVMETKQWAFDSLEEMSDMLKRVEKSVKAVMEDNPHKS